MKLNVTNLTAIASLAIESECAACSSLGLWFFLLLLNAECHYNNIDGFQFIFADAMHRPFKICVIQEDPHNSGRECHGEC